MKTDLLHASNKQQASKCSTESDSFFRVFDLSGFNAREIPCPRPTDSAAGSVPPYAPPCTQLHDTLTVATPPPSGKGMWGCDKPVRPPQQHRTLGRVAVKPDRADRVIADPANSCAAQDGKPIILQATGD